MEEKAYILDRLACGEGSTAVAKALGLNEATVRTIKKNEGKIRSHVAAGSPIVAKKVRCVRDVIWENMEKTLISWIEDTARKRTPLDSKIIRQKAVEIFNELKASSSNDLASTYNFTGSKGWFEKFTKRYPLHDINMKGDAMRDEPMLNQFLSQFERIVTKGGYVADQVFNVDDIDLHWKQMPARTFIAKRDESMANERLNVTLCANASGDLVTKPLVLNTSVNPHSIRDRTKLPVHWRANHNAAMTAELFKDWFFNCFIPEVRDYLNKKRIAFKVLLVMNTSAKHTVNFHHPNVQMFHLPANIKQPLDLGVFQKFKAFYLRRIFKMIADEMDDGDNSFLVPLVWKDFTIRHAVGMIAMTAQELTPGLLNACWKSIWPLNVVDTADNTHMSLQDECQQIISLAYSIGGGGFEDMTMAEVQALLGDSDFTKMQLENTARGGDVPAISLDNINKGLELIEKAKAIFMECDSDTKRNSKFKKDLDKCIAPYLFIQNEMMKKQDETK